MGNVNGREEGGGGGEDDVSGHRIGRVSSSEYITGNSTPPDSPGSSRSPFLFTPQVPVAPLQRGDGPLLFNQAWHDESHGSDDLPHKHGIPTLITWNYGGDDVFVEGSWDNWRSRKQLQRSGKDYSILLVLPSGIYHYKFLVDGEWRYIPDLPFVSDELGHVCNLLDVNVPESPDSSYSQAFPAEEDFAKEPVVVAPQLHLTVLGMQNQQEESTSKPQHVVLNHLFIEKGWASQSVVALGLIHRYQSKYVTVVLYKPLKR
ncbi:Association with the SNF1 complex (ASC) domain [Dillenia turbinata]|uniref:Association with the SNF1 complex (ASC) domain n=1 Tax=Dillenia turbinata TaxID=194707 RepID=A0AAN8V9Y1_9MAGN